MTNSSERSSRRSAARAERLGLRLLLLLLAFAAGGGLAEGYVRIVVNGVKLAWPGTMLTWQLNTAGSDDIADGSHDPAIAHAFQSWQAVTGSPIAFTRGADTSSQAVEQSSHLVLFDEGNTTGYFPGASGIVAITPISFNPATGAIADADVIFNGKDYTFATDGRAGAFDVQDVITHEIGHFIGLDHSPVVTGTMWPYVAAGLHWHSDLGADDSAGALAVASTGADARLTGTLRRDDGAVLRGAHVVAMDVASGRVLGGALSDSAGGWRIRGLPGGDYFVYAAPLKGGMTAANLSGNPAVDTSFSADFYGGFSAPTAFALAAGGATACGEWTLPPETALVDNTGNSFDFLPGQTRTVTLWGSGFAAGGMTILAKSPWISVGATTSGTTWAQADVTVLTGAPLGAYDLYLTGPGVMDPAVGVVDVVAPPPLIAFLDKPSGSSGGGTTVRIGGAGFQPGSFVLFGGLEAAQVSFVDSSNLDVVTPAFGSGTADVVVRNPDGQQARLAGGFTFLSQPTFTQVFPAAGQAAGGTAVLVNGTGFDSGATVRVDGVLTGVEWLSSKLLRITTPAHSPGAAAITIQNPGGGLVNVPGAFSYVSTPDPQVTAFTPDKGNASGGVTVTLSGANLSDTAAVRFGTDPVTGLGGKTASSVTVESPSRIRAVAPAYKTGAYGIVVSLPSGQGVIAPATFTFLPSVAPGAAGGCGGMAGTARGGGLGDLPAWLLLLGAFRLMRRRTARSA